MKIEIRELPTNNLVDSFEIEEKEIESLRARVNCEPEFTFVTAPDGQEQINTHKYGYIVSVVPA